MVENYFNKNNIEFKRDVTLSEFTTFRIGGKVDYLVLPSEINQLKGLLEFFKKAKINYFVIGKGSNILVRDGGLRGVVIKLNDVFNYIKGSGTELRVGAGITLPCLSSEMAKRGLLGLEFAWGIPGTLGGALIMNAGAFGGNIGDLVKEVLLINGEGELKKIDRRDMSFHYRRSSLKKGEVIILEATLLLKEGEPEEIRKKMNEMKKERRSRQPNQPSAGSIFRNPESVAAGKLIEDCGLKGACMGGAKISEKHANFIVNNGNARAMDVLNLISLVQEKVRKNYGVDLELEIEIIGEG